MEYLAFKKVWNKEHPKVLPLGHKLRLAYPERWYRIHSLPDAKRYASSDEEEHLILETQNNIITDIINEGSSITIVKDLGTQKKIHPKNVTSHIWKRYSKDILLKSIAEDEARAIFFCDTSKFIVAPYDGGMDIIVDSAETRNRLRNKHKEFLSSRQDGL